jgi:hypothetical protein
MKDTIKTFSEFSINEESDLQKAYQAFFRGKLEEYNVNSPAELDEEERKKFFNEVSDEWETAKKEQ